MTKPRKAEGRVSTKGAPGPLVSACIIAGNSEDCIGRCLTSLGQLADEINVHLAGSRDGTERIARRFGARITRSEWRKDFAYHRNRSLAMATGRFQLVIDTDESVEDTDKAETRRRLRSAGVPDLLMVREKLTFPNGHTMTMLAPRLLRASRNMRYVYPIHEHLDVIDEPAALSNITICHHGYATEESVTRKEERNLAIAQSMGEHPHGLHSVARSAMALAMWDLAVSAARKLVEMKKGHEPPVQDVTRVETCAIGAACAISAEDLDTASWFVEKGREVDPTAPDILLVAVQAAGIRYLAEAERHNLTSPGAFIRPTVFVHNLARARQGLSLLRGQPGSDSPGTKEA